MSRRSLLDKVISIGQHILEKPIKGCANAAEWMVISLMPKMWQVKICVASPFVKKHLGSEKNQQADKALDIK